MQPEAKIIKTVNAKVELSDVLNTQLFDFEKASESAGWIKELTAGGHATHTPETEEYGITSFAYTRRLPFHAKISSMARTNARKYCKNKRDCMVSAV